MSEPNAPKASPGPSRGAIAAVALTIALLAAMAWFLNRRQPNYKPAPLEPLPAVCPNPHREFVPTNIIDISDPLLDAVPREEKNRTIYRLNFERCTCGCQLSVAYCRGTNSACKASQDLMKKITAEAMGKPKAGTARK